MKWFGGGLLGHCFTDYCFTDYRAALSAAGGETVTERGSAEMVGVRFALSAGPVA